MPKRVELLAPAGDKESFILAINNGADAIYVAGKNYGARAYATNFTNEELKDMIAYAHASGAKLYVTINTVIKNDELNDCISFAGFLYEAGVDAIIIQDLGLISILRAMYPDLTLHASTQMNCASVAYAKELAAMGLKRVILARETPIEVVREIVKNVDIEVETFVHGALCMCYSGNCYLSSVIGKRSGNRGKCAQPCRLPYQLLDYKLDDEEISKANKRYYISPRDLCTIENINELIDAGVTSLKIEGRMKRPEYVGLVVNRYAKAIHSHLDETTVESYKNDLAVMFNRRFTKGYLFGENNKHFTNVATSNHIGVTIGKVTKYSNNYCYIKLEGSLHSGDGLRILSKDNDAIVVNEMFVNGIKGTHAQAGDLIQLRVHKPVDIGSVVLKTSDANLISYVTNMPRKQVKLNAKLYLDGTACLEVSDGVNKCVAKSSFPYEAAKSDSVKMRQIEQLKKTSDLGYYFDKIEVKDNIFLPIKEINELRRMTIEKIDNVRKEVKPVVKNAFVPNNKKVFNQDEKKLLVKVKNIDQFTSSINLGANDIIVDDENLYKEVQSYKNAFPDLNIYLMDKRINDNGILNKKVVDVYSNIINYQSVRVMLESGSEIVGLSIEASQSDIASTISTYSSVYGEKPNVMVMVYGYYELMIMKHCPINKALGKENMHCGECLKKQYYLTDRLGFQFPLVNDGNCHIKLLNCKRLHLVKQLKEILDLGVNNLLVDLSIEDDYEEVLEDYIEAFNACLNNERIEEINPLDEVTYGHYKEGIE